MQNNWKERYISMIGCVDVSNLQIEAAQALKISNLPQNLYKYRAVNEFSLTNLQQDSVWLNIPAEYNDPFEFTEYIDNDRVYKSLNASIKEKMILSLSEKFSLTDEILERAKTTDDYFQVIGEHLFKDSPQKIETLKAVLLASDNALKKTTIEGNIKKIKFFQEQMKVCSFCESPEQLLMWSHYANNHKGFCIEYNISKWEGKDIRNRLLYPVVYQDNLYDSTEHLISTIEKSTFNNLYTLISGATKSKEWEYEKEWRFIIPIGDSFPKQNYYMNCQSKVFLGYRMSVADKNKVIEICTSKKIEVFESVPSNEKYRIEFYPLK